jgi:Caspase domain
MKSLILSLALLSSLISTTSAGQLRKEQASPRRATRRVALVIGNSAYAVGRLRNPTHDARSMAETLRGLGFEVTHLQDLGLAGMKRALREFGGGLKGGGVGLFYYAGHGVQVKGENYLIPVDAAPQSAQEVEYEALSADLVLAQLAVNSSGTNIVILDACRNNPFARGFRSADEGLAAVSAPGGTLVAFATAPGAVASDGPGSSNGVYTQELLRFMRVPGLSVEEVFKRVRVAVRERTQGKQTPWEESSLTGDFYFTPPLASGGGGSKAAPAPATPHAGDGAFEGASVDINVGDLSSSIRLVSHRGEPALAFPVSHIHGGLFQKKGCHGLLYVTRARIIYETEEKKHSFDRPRADVTEAKAANFSTFTADTLGQHISIKYGGETKRFVYYCQNRTGIKGGACGFNIPTADYLFNLTSTDFDAALKKFREFVHAKG